MTGPNAAGSYCSPYISLLQIFTVWHLPGKVITFRLNLLSAVIILHFSFQEASLKQKQHFWPNVIQENDSDYNTETTFWWPIWCCFWETSQFNYRPTVVIKEHASEVKMLHYSAPWPWPVVPRTHIFVTQWQWSSARLIFRTFGAFDCSSNHWQSAINHFHQEACEEMSVPAKVQHAT